jgi:hemolysin III
MRTVSGEPGSKPGAPTALSQPPPSPTQTLEPIKPLLRGRFHQAAFLLAVPAAIVLVAVSRTAIERAATAIFGLSLVAMFGTSAAYHRLQWTAPARERMRRLDHSMIFVLIAGTYAPFSLLVLKAPWSIVLFSVVLVGTVAGILVKSLAIDRFVKSGGALYIVLGWLVVVAAPQIVRGLEPAPLILLIAGGLLYTLGAVVMSTTWPNPSPRVFGYHEIFHLSTVVAAGCHYAAALMVVLARH